MPWFDEICSQLSDEGKKLKCSGYRNPSETNADNLNNVRPEASRYFRNKRRTI
jgi:hypothetical protein